MNERLRKFLDLEQISVRQFEAMIGSSDGKIAKFMQTNSSLKTDTLNKIMEVFPQLSIEWLITGKGSMLKTNVNTTTLTQCRDSAETVPTTPTAQNEQQPTNPTSPTTNPTAHLQDTYGTPTRQLPDKNTPQRRTLPLIPIDAVAGFNGYDAPGISLIDCTQYEIPDFQAVHADFLIRVSGSSMYPKYSSGDILACRKIDEITFLQWGKIYVIDSRQGAMVKRIFEIQDDPTCISCVSDNEKYPPFKLPKSEIRSLSIVVGAIRLE